MKRVIRHTEENLPDGYVTTIYVRKFFLWKVRHKYKVCDKLVMVPGLNCIEIRFKNGFFEPVGKPVAMHMNTPYKYVKTFQKII